MTQSLTSREKALLRVLQADADAGISRGVVQLARELTSNRAFLRISPHVMVQKITILRKSLKDKGYIEYESKRWGASAGVKDRAVVKILQRID